MVLPSPGDWAVGCCLLLCCSRGDPKAALDELTLEFNSWMNVGDAEPKGAVTWAPGTQHLHSDSYGKKQQGCWVGSFWSSELCHTGLSQPIKMPQLPKQKSLHQHQAAWAVLLSTKAPAVKQSHEISLQLIPVCLLQGCHTAQPKALSKCLLLIKNDPELSSMRAFPPLHILWVCLPDGRAAHSICELHGKVFHGFTATF